MTQGNGQSQWSVAAFTALIGLLGALVGAWIGGQAASSAATQQIEAANRERSRENTGHAYIEMTDALVDLRASWTSWANVYPDSPRDKDYEQAYLIPADRELTASINNFTKAVTRIEAFGFPRATTLTTALIKCSGSVGGDAVGEWGGRKPPTDQELEALSRCLFDGIMEFADIADNEISPD